MLFLTFQKSSRNYSYVIWNYNVDPWIIRATMVPVLQLHESRQVRCCCCCCCCFLLVSRCILVHVVLNFFFLSPSVTMRLFLFVNHVDKHILSSYKMFKCSCKGQLQEKKRKKWNKAFLFNLQSFLTIRKCEFVGFNSEWNDILYLFIIYLIFFNARVH